MKKSTAIIMLMIVLSLALAACNRPLSKAPAEVPATAAPTNAAEEPFEIDDETPAAEAPTQAPAAATESAAEPETASTVQAAAPTTAPTTAPTLAPVVVDTPVVPASYVLQQGEYPYCLARRFDVDPNTLLSVNGLSQNSWVSPGTTLTIPTGSSWSGAPRSRMAHPATYTVKSGDTIYSIACDFGDVFPESIAQANNMQAPYALTVGQTLQIP